MSSPTCTPPLGLLGNSANDANDGRRRCRRRRRRKSPCAGGVVTVAIIAAIAAATTTKITRSVEAFATISSPTTTIASACCQSPPSLTLSAVHKRSGKHEYSTANRAAISSAASRATAAQQHATTSTARNFRSRKSNVFEQFTPEFVTSSPFDVVDLQQQQHQQQQLANGNNGHAAPSENNSDDNNNSNSSNRINLRLQTLLGDDTGEQEMEMYPDHSPEAALQLAEPKSYGRLSEEARRKANLAVSSEENDSEGDGEDTEDGGGASTMKAKRVRGKRVIGARGNKSRRGGEARNDGGGADDAKMDDAPPAVTLAPSAATKASSVPQRRRVGRVRATVQETGSDSMSTYIKSLGRHELLCKEDETLLGRQVRMLTSLEERRMELEEELLRPPTFAQWAAATCHTVPSLKQQIRRSQRAKAALIEANLRLVITVARQATKRQPSRSPESANSVQFQDACQQGIIGLTRATEKFDPELGFRFSTYAIWWIQKEVAKNVSEQSRSVRIPHSAMTRINDIRIKERVLMAELGRRPDDEELAERAGMSVEKLNFYRRSAQDVGSLDKTIDARKGKGSMSTGGDSSGGSTMDTFVRDTEHPSPSELADREMLKEDVRRLVRTLSPREQAVIRLRFGLDDGAEPMGIADIGAKFGVEKERIKKIEARALLKLRQPGRSSVVKCYVSDHT